MPRAGETIGLVAHEGEIVGLAGLAGQGQTEMLLRVFDGARGDTTVDGSVAVVAGDRHTDGIFPLVVDHEERLDRLDPPDAPSRARR